MEFEKSVEIVDGMVRWSHWQVVKRDTSGVVHLALGSLLQSRLFAIGTAQHQATLWSGRVFDVLPACVVFPEASLNERSLNQMRNGRDVPNGPADDARFVLSDVELQTAPCILVLYSERGDPLPFRIAWTEEGAIPKDPGLRRGGRASGANGLTLVSAELAWPATINLSRSEEFYREEAPYLTRRTSE